MAQLRTFLNSLRLTYPSLLISRGFLFMGKSGYLNNNYKHGMKGSPEYNAWQNMKKRCYNKNTPNYDKYGGRGITICDEWRYSFINFYKDMGDKPFKDYSLDRIDNNKGYSKSNCRWASRTIQNRNQGNRLDNITGVKGVFFCNRSQKWCAQINTGKKRKHLGYFSKFDEAVKAREIGEIKYWNG